MKKLSSLFAALFCLVWLTGATWLPLFQTAGGGGTNHLAFDTATTVGSTGGPSTTVTLTTTQTNDIVVLCIQANISNAAIISDTAGLSWVLVENLSLGNNQVYYAKSPSILSSDVITVNYGTTVAFDSVQAAAFSGSNTTTPLDSNGALPGTTSSATPLTLTTSNNFDLLIACYALNGSASAGTGWTGVPNTGSTGFDLFEYQIVNTTQSATPANTSSNSQIKRGSGSAIVSR